MFSFKYLTIVWGAIILVLSLTPGNYIPPVEFKLLAPDTIAHLLFYGLLNYLLYGTYNVSTSKAWLIIALFAFCILYGFVIELIQGSLIPGRFYDLADVYANTIGSFIGATTYLLSRR